MHNKMIASVALFLFAAEAQSATPTVAGCPSLPADSVWNTPVDNLPVHPQSSTYINTVGAGYRLHADFGGGYWNAGQPFGLPWTTVPGTQPKVPVSFYIPTESDPGPYPLPPTTPVQGDTDRHTIVLDRDNCMLYEMWDAHMNPDGSWWAGVGAKFDLRSNALRPMNWTSANAAGMPFLPGIVRYDEVASGQIEHALLMTANYTGDSLVWPARHHTYLFMGPNYPPMGTRLRLKASVDISGFDPQVQVVLRALKKYGAFINDNGGPWFIAGEPDARWYDPVWATIHNLSGSDLEIIDESSLMVNPDSGAVRTAAPQISISITPSSVTLPAGQSQQFSAPVNGTSNTGVSWAATAGTITPTGLYTAPSGISGQMNVTVTASSVADPSKTAGATVTVIPSVSVSVSPAAVTLTNGQSQQFAAAVNGAGNTAVTWSAAPAGSISSTGLYTAPGSITAPQMVTVTATSQADGSKSASATVSLVPGAAVSLTYFDTPPITYSSTASSGLVNLSGPAPQDTTIGFWSSNPPVSGYPASVTVKAGSSTATFPFNPGVVPVPTPVTVVAKLASKEIAITFWVHPPAVQPGVGSVSIASASLLGGASTTLSFTLDAPAPAGGATVSASSSQPGVAAVPAAVQVPAGSTAGTLTVTTSAVTTTAQVTITLTSGGRSQSLLLTVNAPAPIPTPIPTPTPDPPPGPSGPAIAGVFATAPMVSGGGATALIIVISSSAPGGGASITISSSDPAVIVPSTFSIPEGGTMGICILSTNRVSSSTTSTLTLTSGGQSKTLQITVLP